MKLHVSALLVALLSLLGACHEDAPQVPANKLPKDPTERVLVEFNKGYVDYEQEEIKRYVDSLHLELKTSPEGILYCIEEPGNGRKPEVNQMARVEYTVTLLDGSTCPQLKGREQTYKVGSSEMRTGLDMCARMLRPGGKGRFIVPALLAYGVAGKKGCVPPYTPVVCHMQLIEVK